MRRTGVLSALLIIGGLSIAAAGVQGPPSRQPPVLERQKLRDNLYLVTGGGGHSLAFITDLGVVLIDTKLVGSGKLLLDQIKAVTPKPVTTIINTHAHGESVGGNESFPTSVEIVAQQNTRLTMDKMSAFQGPKVLFLPKLMFKEKMTIGSGRDRIDLYYFGAGHTSGDAWVVFPALRVAHLGDLLAPEQLPTIDLESGGSGLAYPETLARGAATLKNIDTVVPSHGGLKTMKDVEEYAQLTRDFRDAVVSGFNHGLGVGEVADAWMLPDKYRAYTATPERVKANVQMIFSELTR